MSNQWLGGVSETGCWQGLFVEIFHAHDAALAAGLVNFFQREGQVSVGDFGCGLGDYVKMFRKHGIACEGFDGNPQTTELTRGLCSVRDFAEEQHFDPPFDWIVALEVGEHIPPQYERTFIENLHRNNRKGIVVSWAVEGQGGLGHFNCRNNDYIKQLFKELGYYNDMDAENKLRAAAVVGWFKETLMVFRRKL